MIAYKYDETTLEYIGTCQAQLDPVETKKQKKEVFLCPGNATIAQPPVQKKGYAITFDTEKQNWKYTLDYRGKKAYNATGIFEITYIGDLQGSDKLLTKKQEKGLNDGTLVFKDGEIIPKPVEDQIAQLEQQIEELNAKMLRDIIVLQDENATQEEKASAQTYLNTKISRKKELISQINELKNDETEE